MYSWESHSIQLKADRRDLLELDQASSRRFLTYLTGAAMLDGLRFKSISYDLLDQLFKAEIDSFIGCQIVAEQNHLEMYGRLLSIYAVEEFQRELICKTLEFFPSVSEKAEWLSGMKETEIVVFSACIKGIFGSVLYAGGLFYKSEGKMSGFSKAICLILRDLEVQLKFLGKLYHSKDKFKVERSRVDEIVEKAVELEIFFAQEFDCCDVLGIDKSEMDSYIQYRGDEVLRILGFTPHDETPFPIWFRHLQNAMVKRELMVELEPRVEGVPEGEAEPMEVE